MASEMKDHSPEVELKKVFRLYDHDETGEISLENLKRVARDLGETVPDSELEGMLKCADYDEDGRVMIDDFLRLMKEGGLLK